MIDYLQFVRLATVLRGMAGEHSYRVIVQGRMWGFAFIVLAPRLQPLGLIWTSGGSCAASFSLSAWHGKCARPTHIASRASLALLGYSLPL